LYLSILSPGFSTRSWGVESAGDRGYSTVDHDVRVHSVPVPLEETAWEIFFQDVTGSSEMSQFQKVTVLSNTKSKEQKFLLFWQYYHTAVLQAKEENSKYIVQVSKGLCVGGEALLHGNKVCHR